MALNFPDNPQLNDTFTVNGRTYTWNGQKWRKVRPRLANTSPTLSVSNDFAAGGALHVDATTGRVGIGTASPAVELHVDGNVEFTGTLDVTGLITSATATAATNDTTVATTAYVQTALASLVDSAPATLDTLNELAAALGDDANFSTTVTNSLAGKADSGHSHGGESPIGSMMPYAGSSAPNSFWLICDGSAVSRTTYATLFSLIGTTYGSGNGSTTFNIPNLKGRVVVGVDASQAEFNVLGETGGAKTHTLSEAELPAHGHTFTSGNSDSTLNHRHSISHNHAAVTSGKGSSHTHSGSFGSSNHRHNIQIGLHDYYFKASAAYSGMSTYGLSNYNISWAGSYNLASSSETVNTSSSYAAVSHTVFGSIGQSNTPNATAGVGSESNHTHSVDLPSYSGNSSYLDLTNHTHSGTTNDTGSNVAHNNLQPYIALNYIIKAV